MSKGRTFFSLDQVFHLQDPIREQAKNRKTLGAKRELNKVRKQNAVRWDLSLITKVSVNKKKRNPTTAIKHMHMRTSNK